jgi:hypothetical protein
MMTFDPQKWGPFIFSAVIFGAWIYTLVTHQETETAKNLTMVAAGFWLGSSLGSLKKTDAQLAQLPPSPTNPDPK